jgi:hypothetical protein
MISIAYDPSTVSLVVLESKPASGDADYERAVQAVRKLATDANAASKTGTFLMMVDPGIPAPSAEWRRRFAEAELAFQHLDMLFITKSGLARGVITAVRWLAGARPGVWHQTEESFESGLATLEKRAGKKLPHLASLRDEARRQADGQGRRAS